MKSKSLVTILCAYLFVTLSNLSGQVARAPLAADGSNVDIGDPVVMWAWNAGGASDVTWRGITWRSVQPAGVNITTYGAGSHPTNHNTNVAQDYTNVNLGSLMSTAIRGGWQNDNVSLRIELLGLTVGQEYQLQILSDNDPSQSPDLITAYTNVDGTLGPYSNARRELTRINFNARSDGNVVGIYLKGQRAHINGVLLTHYPKPEKSITWLHPTENGNYKIDSSIKDIQLDVGIASETGTSIDSANALEAAGWIWAEDGYWENPDQNTLSEQVTISVLGLPEGEHEVYFRFFEMPSRDNDTWWYFPTIFFGANTGELVRVKTPQEKIIIRGTGGVDWSNAYDAKLGSVGADGVPATGFSLGFDKYRWAALNRYGSIRIESIIEY